jgi:segregation and condensation protein A
MIQFQLKKFEGPLDLLLYLIRKEEMDIFDIPIQEITRQYLEHIKLMQELDLEVAGEFVAMASTLIHIKSKMLLPQYDENGEVVEQEDPRKELVQRLLEYQKYQEAAQKLYERPLLNRDIWARGTRLKLEDKEEEIVLEENALFSLISVYRNVSRSIKKRIHQVNAKTQSIASRIRDMREKLVIGIRVGMSEFIQESFENIEARRKQVLITFLSILELGKMGLVSIYQPENFSEIYIEATKAIDSESLSRVEEYDSMQADDAADRMMAQAAKMDVIDADSAEDHIMNDETTAVDQLEVAEEGISLATDEEILAAELEENLIEGELQNDRSEEVGV